jgi:hypothetical protein
MLSSFGECVSFSLRPVGPAPPSGRGWGRAKPMPGFNPHLERPSAVSPPSPGPAPQGQAGSPRWGENRAAPHRFSTSVKHTLSTGVFHIFWQLPGRGRPAPDAGACRGQGADHYPKGRLRTPDGTQSGGRLPRRGAVLPQREAVLCRALPKGPRAVGGFPEGGLSLWTALPRSPKGKLRAAGPRPYRLNPQKFRMHPEHQHTKLANPVI